MLTTKQARYLLRPSAGGTWFELALTLRGDLGLPYVRRQGAKYNGKYDIARVPHHVLAPTLPRRASELDLLLDLGQVHVEKADALFRQHTTSDPVAASLIAAQPARFEQARQWQA